jgi:hypothetical protein
VRGPDAAPRNVSVGRETLRWLQLCSGCCVIPPHCPTLPFITPQRVTFLEGAAGPMALMAVLLHESGSPPEWSSHLDSLLAMADKQVGGQRPVVSACGPWWLCLLKCCNRYSCNWQAMPYLSPQVAALPAGECEILYGRAGYLWALLWAQSRLPPGSIPRTTLKVGGVHLL